MNKLSILLPLLCAILLLGVANATCPTPITPAVVQYYQCITLMNTQGSPVIANTAINVTLDAGSVSTYLASNVMNAEFFYQNGTVANAILWGNVLALGQTTSLSSSNTLMYWFKSPAYSTYLGASATNYIYIGYASTSTNLFNNYDNGEAPTLTTTYGTYDDGNQVFSEGYCSWIGTTNCASWTSSGSGFTINNGLIMNGAAGFSGVTTVTNYTAGNVVDIYGTESPSYGGGNNWGGFVNSVVADNKLLGFGINVYTSGKIDTVAYAAHGGEFNTGKWILTSYYSSSAGTAMTQHNFSAITTESAGSSTALSAGYTCSFSTCTGTWTANWIDVRIAPPNYVQPTKSFGVVTQITGTGLSITPNPATYGTSTVSIVGTFVPASDSGELIITGGIYGTSNIVATGTGTVSYTVPNPTAAGSYSINSYDTVAMTSNVGILVINQASPILTFPIQCSVPLQTWTSYGCQTEANIVTINNQVTATLYLSLNGVVPNYMSKGTATVNLLLANTIAVGNYSYAFNTITTANYVSNNLDANFYIYQPVLAQNTLGTTIVTPTIEGLVTNQLNSYYPLYISTSSPSSTLTYSINQSYNGGTNTAIQTSAQNLNYLPPSNQLTGNYLFYITENEVSPFGSLVFPFNAFVNMTDVQNALTTNSPIIQYFPNLANFSEGTFTASPTNWSLVSNPVSATRANTLQGDVFQSNAIIYPVNIILRYKNPAVSFTLNMMNNPAVQATLTQNGFQFFTNSMPPNQLISRKIYVINTYGEPLYTTLNTVTVISALTLFNNYTIPLALTTNNLNTTNVYMPLGNFQNPSILLTNQTTFTTAPSYSPRRNNFFDGQINSSTFKTLSIYLPQSINSSYYAFSVYRCAGYANNASIGIMNGVPSSSKQVELYKMNQIPFTLPLLNGFSYFFVIYQPNGQIIYNSSPNIWTSPISLFAPCTIVTPILNVSKISVTCNTQQIGINGITLLGVCSGIDKQNLVSSWTVNFTNQTTLVTSTTLNSVTLSGSAFSTNFILPSNSLPYTATVIAHIGNQFDPQYIYNFNLGFFPQAPIDPNFLFIGLFLILLPLVLAYFHRVGMLIVEIFVIFLAQALHIFSFSVADLGGFIVLAVLLIIIDERSS